MFIIFSKNSIIKLLEKFAERKAVSKTLVVRRLKNKKRKLLNINVTSPVKDLLLRKKHIIS